MDEDAGAIVEAHGCQWVVLHYVCHSLKGLPLYLAARYDAEFPAPVELIEISPEPIND
jgi:hypothetical protein